MSESADETQLAEEAPAQETDWKAEARKWEDRSKANCAELEKVAGERDAHAARIQELETSSTEWETKYNTLAAEQKHAKDVADVAAEHGVDASLLRGSDRDELEAHAKAIQSAFSKTPPAPAVPGQEKSPQKISGDPDREAVKQLFG